MQQSTLSASCLIKPAPSVLWRLSLVHTCTCLCQMGSYLPNSCPALQDPEVRGNGSLWPLRFQFSSHTDIAQFQTPHKRCFYLFISHNVWHFHGQSEIHKFNSNPPPKRLKPYRSQMLKGLLIHYIDFLTLKFMKQRSHTAEPSLSSSKCLVWTIIFPSDLVMFVLTSVLHHSSYMIKTTLYNLAYGLVDK